MFNLFDILQSQAGPGMQTIGRQFGLTPDQSRSAMEALLPALTVGLQRSAASDPIGFGRFLGLAGAAPYPGTRPQAPPQPDVLGQLFGSPLVNQAVLQQAATASGLGTQALRQMLPVMAGMVVAGIVHVLLNQPPIQPAVPPPRQEPQPSIDPGFPVTAFWNDWVNQFVGSTEPAGAGSASAKPGDAGGRAPPAAARALPEPEEAKPPPAEDASFEVFQQMFQTGVQVQEQNARAMQDIFDAFWSAPPTSSADAGAAEAEAAPTDAVEPKPGKNKRRKAQESR